jgi:hypothetical protein
MRIFIWILIIGFIWMILMPIHEGFRRPKINIKKTITKTANTVGGTIAKIATAGLPEDAKKVLKNLGKIKESIRSFTAKGGDDYVAIPLLSPLSLKAQKCGVVP